MKLLAWISMMALFASCMTAEQKEYQKLNSLPLQEAVYKTTFRSDSVTYDTLTVSVENGNLMMVDTYMNASGKPMKLYIHHEHYQISEEGDSVTKETAINYDLTGDSIQHIARREKSLGETRSYLVNGVRFKVLKQPRWIFAKSEEPNLVEFYAPPYGLILRLSRGELSELVYLPSQPNDPNLAELIRTVKADRTFFDRRRKGRT